MFDHERLLGVLVSHSVEFIVVGGVAAALQGAPVLTQDVDILYRIEEQNLARLERALNELNAVARGAPRNLRFGLSHLRTTGHKLATTDAGPLDVLGAINEDLLYEDLIAAADELEVGGHCVRVLSLQRLIELKQALGRPKDRAMLPVLEATLRERERR
ncbi:MAG TPA: nucleotidyltransferase [Polyangiaceae bacterium]|nr:nucleotidyltransferase [Polyangiaceae bacterium]